MKFKSDITIIIHTEPESAVFGKSLNNTVDSIVSQGSYDPRRISIAVIASEDTEGLQALVDDSLSAESPKCQVISMDELADAVAGSKYLFLIENGDTLEEGALEVLLKHAKKNYYTVVFLVNRQYVKKKKSDFRSCTLAETDPRIAVRGVLIRNKSIKDLRKLVAHDRDAIMELTKTIIRAKGYYLESNAILTKGSIENPVFLPDPVRMQQLIDFTEEVFPGASMYVERYILKLCSRNIKLKSPHNESVDAEFEDAKSSLQIVRDETILTVPGYNIHKRLHFLKLKYGKDVMEEVQLNDDGSVYWQDQRLFSVSARNRFKINIFDITDGEILVSGITDLNVLGPKYHIVVIEENGNRIPVDLKPDPVRNLIEPNGEIIHEAKQFDIRIPLRTGSNFEFILEDENERQIVLVPGMGRFSRMTGWPQGSYFVKKGVLISEDYGRFYVEKNTAWKHLKAECEYDRRLWLIRKRAVIVYRLMHYFYHIFQRKPVWIVADRPHVAGDNGEHMFRYLVHSDAAKTHDIRFLIRKDSKDYSRIKSIGPVLEYKSLKHRLKFMDTTMVIAAAANNLATSAFGKSQKFYRNICDNEFVYLRHGVAKDDQSRWLNRQRKNIRILLSTSVREHDAIIAGKYGYTEREVKLTGLPRYDNLYDERQKKITILPTWRKNLEGDRIKESSEREYIFDFKDTDYFKFYDALINNERLLNKMRELHFTGSFYLHPVFEEQFNDFTGNDVFEIGTTIADYQTLFRESSIMVTDFSSVAFDFAYLKKPLVYSQFDEDTFYQDHSWDRGYFSYHEDGFGPITNTVDETVDALIHYLENGCEMEELYLKRVDAFFPFNDRNNCKRVYDAIMEVDAGR